jgi:2-amino-4-hydroxy-6-hydroxymethyldihydropteridine diphosphokinase
VARALAYLGLGSNQGDPATFIRKAVVALGELPDTTVRAVSGLYRTAPVGFVDQPDFLNAAVAVETGLEPRELLEAVQGIEAAFARTRDIRWGPRTLDVDILWYDGRTVRDDGLELPHPRIGERRFVLEPLSEIAPDLELCDGRSVREALADAQGQRVTRVSDHVEQGGAAPGGGEGAESEAVGGSGVETVGPQATDG